MKDSRPTRKDPNDIPADNPLDSVNSLSPSECSASLAASTYWRIIEVAVRLRVSRKTLYAWMSLGKFPRPRVFGNGRLGYLPADITEWLEHAPVNRRKRNVRGGGEAAVNG